MLLMQAVDVVTVNCYIAEAVSTGKFFYFVVSDPTADSSCTYKVHAGAPFTGFDNLLAGLKQSPFA